jgi:radical SAM superfamily enzyme YgiQ (UPF0313 family)
LEQEGFSVSIAENVKPSLVGSLVEEHRPRIVGVSVSSPTAREAKKVIDEVKKADRDCMVVVGGSHVTTLPESVGVLGADYGLAGECEESFPSLCEHILRGVGNTESINGLVKGGANAAGEVPYTQNLDALPFPSFGLLDLRAYGSIPIELSRGCPYDCVYCTRCFTRKVRFKSPEVVAGELEHHLKAYGAGIFSFVDDVFTLESERVRDLCEEFSRRRLKVSWSCTTRADCVDEEVFRLMKEAGCRYVSFGLESGVERIRFQAGKEVSNKAYEKAFGVCRKLKIASAAHVLFGLPGEVLSDMRDTVSFVRELAPTYAVFRSTIVLPGSRLFGIAVDDGVVSPDCWRVFAEKGGKLPYYVPEGVSFCEMEGLRRQAISSFYFNGKYLADRILKPNSAGEFLGLPYFMYLVGRFSPDFP